MTLDGTVNKATYSISLVLIFGIIGFRNFNILENLLIPGLIIGLIIAIVTDFKKHLAHLQLPCMQLFKDLF